MPKATGQVAIGVILVALGAHFATNINDTYAATPLSGYGETKVVVNGDYQYCLEDKVKITGLQFMNSSGNSIEQLVATGVQVYIQATIDNGCDIPHHPATILLEVRDSDSITRYLAFQQIALEPNHQPRVGFSWAPDEPGDYEVRVFAITCPNCTGVFAPMMTQDISVY